jgi:hypothetical protein
MQPMRGDCQAPWSWELVARPSFGLDSREPRLRMKCQQGRVLRDAVR